MADISKINLSGAVYNIKDATARANLNEIQSISNAEIDEITDLVLESISSSYIYGYETAAAMQADLSLQEGMIAHTNGFTTSGDGDAAYYTISNSGTADGSTILALQNGLRAIKVSERNLVDAIPNMSTTTRGIAKVGAGLTMNDDILELDSIKDITPTKIHDLDIPSGYYTQGLVIVNDIIYVSVVSSSSGNPRIYKFNFTTGDLIGYTEYLSTIIGHQNSMTFEPTAQQLVTIGPDNNTLVYIDIDTMEVAGTHTLSAPLSEFCINADGTSAFAIATGRRVGQQYFKDSIDNLFVARNNAPIYTNELIGQDISYSLSSSNFVAAVFFRSVAGKKYNYIYQIDCYNGFNNRIYFVNVPTTTEIEGIASYNGTQYIIDNAGNFYRADILNDYRTSVPSLYPLLNWNKTNNNHTSTFADGTHTFNIPIYFPIPHDIRDIMQGVPILFRTTQNNYQLNANNTGGTIRGFTVTTDGQHTIGLDYTSNSANIAYLSRVRIDDTAQTFSGTNVTSIESALDTYIGGVSLDKNIGLNYRGYGVTPYAINNTIIPVNM